MKPKPLAIFKKEDLPVTWNTSDGCVSIKRAQGCDCKLNQAGYLDYLHRDSTTYADDAVYRYWKSSTYTNTPLHHGSLDSVTPLYVDSDGLHRLSQLGETKDIVMDIFGNRVEELVDGSIMITSQLNYAILPRIEKVIFNPPATVVIWKDGTKTVVKSGEEEFSEEYGLAMAIVKKMFKSRNQFKKCVKDAVRVEPPKPKEKKKPAQKKQPKAKKGSK